MWACIIPSAAAYVEYFGGTKGLSGLVIGIYAIAGGVNTYPMQLFLDQFGIKRCMLFQLGLVSTGALVYIFSAAWGTIATLFIGRAISGSGMNNLAIYYVSRAAGKNVRSKWMVHISASTAMGYGIGPAVGAIMVAAFKTDETPDGIIILDNKVWNELTAPLWGMIGLLACQWVVALLFFQEPPLEGAEVAARKNKKEGSIVAPGDMSPTTRAKETFTKSQLLGIASNIAVFFCIPLLLGCWEVHTVNMVQETWNYSIAIASVYIASVSLCLVPISILMSIYLVPHLSDRKSIFICFSAALVACAGFYDYFVNRRPDVDSLAATRTMDAAVWTSAGLIFLTAINISRGSALSLLTKQVPTKHKILINTINLTLFMIGRG